MEDKSLTPKEVMNTINEMAVIFEDNISVYNLTWDYIDKDAGIIRINTSAYRYDFRINKNKKTFEYLNGQEINPTKLMAVIADIVMMEMAYVFCFGNEERKKAVIETIQKLPQYLLISALLTKTVRNEHFQELIPYYFNGLRTHPRLDEIKKTFFETYNQPTN